MNRKYKIMVIITMIFLVSVFTLVGCGGSAAIEDIRWILTSYGNPDDLGTIIPDTEPSVSFNSENGQVKGSGGCNSFFGDYEVNGKNLDMKGPFAVTEMWCGDEIGAQESEYLDILLLAERYEVENGKLTIYSGSNVLNFVEE